MLYFLLILNTICTLLPLLAKNKQSGLKLSMFIIFVFLSLRYNFGNDYMAYYDNFYNMSFSDRANADVELGYNALCSIFRPLGFYSLQVFLAAIYTYALYSTIKTYAMPRFYWIVVFCIISNADLLFFGASAMRQTLAFSVVLLGLPYLSRKRLTYFLYVGIATLFHQSAIFFAILYPLMFINLSNKKFIICFAGLAILLMTVLKEQFYTLINIVLSSAFEKYESRYGDSDLILMDSTIGIAVRILFMLFFLTCLHKSKDSIKSIFLVLAVLCVVIFTMRDQVMLQRYTMYFGYMMAFAFTYVLETIKRGSAMMYIFLSLVILWHLKMSISFASSTNALFEYHTIFEAL